MLQEKPVYRLETAWKINLPININHSWEIKLHTGL